MPLRVSGKNLDIGEALRALPAAPRTVFVCGSNRFVEGVTQPMLDLGVPAAIVRTERFGGA